MEKRNTADNIIYWISLLMIALGVILRLVTFLYNRSLFIDEAYLASSVIQRDYSGLFQKLDFSQGAPVGFLWLVKTCVLLFGPSEYSLRLVSLLSGLASIALFYILLKQMFADQRPYIGTAFFATIPFLIYYSIEFKPYMLDGFLTLLSVYLFFLAARQKINIWGLGLYCALVLWFSLPALFTVAAACIVWLIYSILKKQKEAILASLVTGTISLVSFGILFETVYRNAQTNQSKVAQFWNLIKFPLIPHSLEDIKLIYQMGSEYLRAFDKGPAIVLLLISLLALALLWNKKRAWFGIFLFTEMILLFTASWLVQYGMVARLLLFIIPLHILFVSTFISNLWSKWKMAAMGLSLVFVIVNIGSARYFSPQNIFRASYEINPVLHKLDAMDRSIPLYLYAHAIPQYEYKTGYKAGLRDYPNAPFEINNVIYGSYFFTYKYKVPYSFESEIDPARLDQNIQAITSHNQAYILFVTYDIKHRDALITALKKSGSVSEVINIYATPLYLYYKY